LGCGQICKAFNTEKSTQILDIFPIHLNFSSVDRLILGFRLTHIYETQMPITFFTGARRWFLYWARWIQCPLTHPISFLLILSCKVWVLYSPFLGKTRNWSHLLLGLSEFLCVRDRYSIAALERHSAGIRYVCPFYFWMRFPVAWIVLSSPVCRMFSFRTTTCIRSTSMSPFSLSLVLPWENYKLIQGIIGGYW
jgi:hypothetical protein